MFKSEKERKCNIHMRIRFVLFILFAAVYVRFSHAKHGESDGKDFNPLACPSTLKSWSELQKSFGSITELSSFELKLRFAFQCSQLTGQLALFQDKRLTACLAPILKFGKLVSFTTENNQAHVFEVPNIDVLALALHEYLKQNPSPLSNLLKATPGSEAIHFASHLNFSMKDGTLVSGREALFIALPQKDGSILQINVADNEDPDSALVPLLRLSKQPTKTAQYATLQFNGTAQEKSFGKATLKFDRSNSCFSCHVSGFIPITHDQKLGSRLRSFGASAVAPAEMLSAINKKYTDEYLHSIPPGLACIGPSGSSFRDEHLNKFLQKKGIQSFENREKLRAQMNCAKCHSEDDDVNPLCFPLVPDNGRFNILEHSLIDAKRMPPKEVLSDIDRKALGDALTYEYFGQLDPKAPDYEMKWRGLLINSILENPCPET